MNFDLHEARCFIDEVVKSAPDTKSGMIRLLDFCEKLSPNTTWSTIRNLDYESDIENLGVWLKVVLTAEPPSKEINAFWFGLFNPVLENGEVSSRLYISGSTVYDPVDRSADWAVWRKDSYLPEGKYARSIILHEIYRKVNENDVAQLGEYVLCLGYASLAVKAICGRLDKKLLLGELASRAVVVGFDDGDYIVLDI